MAVNWDGFNRISTTNGGIRDALDCYCTGPNWCYIAAYSAGNLQIGYALSLYGTSQRFKKNPTPNAAGQCSNSDGGTVRMFEALDEDEADALAAMLKTTRRDARLT